MVTKIMWGHKKPHFSLKLYESGKTVKTSEEKISAKLYSKLYI